MPNAWNPVPSGLPLQQRDRTGVEAAGAELPLVEEPAPLPAVAILPERGAGQRARPLQPVGGQLVDIPRVTPGGQRLAQPRDRLGEAVRIGLGQSQHALGEARPVGRPLPRVLCEHPCGRQQLLGPDLGPEGPRPLALPDRRLETGVGLRVRVRVEVRIGVVVGCGAGGESQDVPDHSLGVRHPVEGGQCLGDRGQRQPPGERALLLGCPPVRRAGQQTQICARRHRRDALRSTGVLPRQRFEQVHREPHRPRGRFSAGSACRRASSAPMPLTSSR